MLNYTVTSTQIEAVAGSQVNLTTPFILLTITPDPGYAVVAGDFSIGDALPSEISTVVFVQDGNNIEAQVNFDNSFIMPSSAVSLGIDIDGTADLITYSVAGAYETVTDNTNLTSTPSTAYSGSGVIGDNVLLFALAFTADANHVFEVDPVAEILTATLPSNYDIARVDTFDADSNLTQVVYTVRYTITGENITGDSLKFTANALEQLVITPGTEEYFSYVFQDMPLVDVFGKFYIDNTAQQHILQIFGQVGAMITLDYTASGGLTVPSTNIVTNLEITNPVGYVKIPIDFLVAPSATDYQFTLSGDITAGFVQPNPILVSTSADIVVDLDYGALAGHTVVKSGVYSVSGQEGPVSRADQLNTTFSALFTITADDGSVINLDRIPTWDDFSNLASATNGGTEIQFTPALTVLGNGTQTITIEAVATVTTFGNANVTSVLSLSTVFNNPPVAVTDYIDIKKGKTKFMYVLANDTTYAGALTVSDVSTPSYGTIDSVSTFVEYSHDNSTNYEDSFTYKADDGTGKSDTTTVYIYVGIAPGFTQVVSGGEGIYDIEVVIGETLDFRNFHFNAGSVPARMQVFNNGALSGETLFVGDNLIGAGRAAAISAITGTSGLDSFQWVGGEGNGDLHGQSKEWQLITAGNLVSYSDPVDISATGTSRTVDPNPAAQQGVIDLTYTSKVDTVGTTGLDQADGNVAIEVVLGSVPTATIRITGIAGSAWELYQITE